MNLGHVCVCVCSGEICMYAQICDILQPNGQFMEIQSYTPRHLTFLQMLDLLALRRCPMTSRIPCTASIPIDSALHAACVLGSHRLYLTFYTTFSTRRLMRRWEAGGDAVIDHMSIVICALPAEITIQSPPREIINATVGADLHSQWKLANACVRWPPFFFFYFFSRSFS